jgi:hypothetical protein
MKKPIEKGNEVMTITFGDCGENHYGNQQIGKKVLLGQGFNYEDFLEAKKKAEKLDCEVDIIDLKELISDYINENKEFLTKNKIEINPAYLIFIRGAITKDHLDKIYAEMNTFEWDTKYFDVRRQKVLNKLARSVVCFDQNDQEPDYENKKGRIISFNRLPELNRAKSIIADIFGDKAKELIGEGNRYKNKDKNGIGYHGDVERRKVIAVRLNEKDKDGDTKTMPICFNWFYKNKSIGTNVSFDLPHGTIYAMSEYATGNNWKSSSIHTIRHAAGADKYTKIK